jgi:transglutaminase-like putative cysteine protease
MSNPAATRQVGCELSFELAVPSRLALHVAVAGSATVLEERFRVVGATAGDEPVAVAAEHGGRIQLVDAGPGRLDVTYTATVGADGRWPPDAPSSAPRPQREGAAFGLEQLVALRQSRYCPSDQLAGLAATTFGDLADPLAKANAIGEWVFERLSYEPGASRSTDTAIDTLLGGKGVCRDFAHLTIALLRAVGVPARLVAVYAPGLTPMDFHAVTEVWDGHGWLIVDSTRLAPRSSLIRIATGRDAADTAFATVVEGDVELLGAEVFAIVDGDLPADDHVSPWILD